ncbi:MAG: hypothetical protein AABX89_06995 [Candidatus Thermoplasmatota archaeon]
MPPLAGSDPLPVAVAAKRGALEGLVVAAQRRVADGVYDNAPEGRKHGSFVAAVTARSPGIIAELKPRSPSEGPLLRMDAMAYADEVVAGGADALSILTDADYFGGSLSNLAQASRLAPCLMKDFIVAEPQLDAAERAGAAAVLLIERILGPERRAELLRAAQDRGLEVLLEVHGAREATSVQGCRADLVGVNARDLNTFRVDRAGADVALRTLAREGPVALLSGVRDRRDVQEATAAGAQAVLVGTTLLRSRLPRLAARSLRRPLAKVCGLRTVADVEVARGADLVGFVLSDRSPRAAASEELPRLVAAARAAGLATVLVSDLDDTPRILQAARSATPDIVQLHHAAASARGALQEAGFAVFLAVEPDQALPEGVDGFVFDSIAAGGSGRTHDWTATRARLEGLRGTLSLVAGGLDAKNAADALAASGASGADASSRLETAPGRKDEAAVRAFIAAVQGASA